MIRPDFLKAEAIKHGVSRAELEVLCLVVEGHSTNAIAQKLKISPDAVRQRLSQMYQKFHIPGTGPVKLKNLIQMLMTRYQEHLAQSVAGASSNIFSPGTANAYPRKDWGEAPDVSVFYGRTEELEKLEEWIVEDNCRLVALLGMPGIGKTSLAVKLARQIEDNFEFTIWRSLRNAPPVDELVADLLKTLSGSQPTDSPKKVDEAISLLMGYLCQHRCLVVLDNVEMILCSDESGPDTQVYQEYRLLLKRIGEARHQSCLLVSSQEKPKEIKSLESFKRPVRSWELKGLDLEAAKKILQEKSLTGSEKCWEELIVIYRGNPLALKLVAATIENVFNKNVDEFIKFSTFFLDSDYRQLLDWQFKRLSDLEKEILRYLAKEDNAISFQKLRGYMPDTLETSELIEALDSLGRRYLIEKYPIKDRSEAFFSLQPIVKKYVKKNHLQQAMSKSDLLHQS